MGAGTVPTGHFSAYGIYGVVNTALYNTFGVYGGPSNTIYAVVTPPGVADDTPTDAGFNSDSTMWIGVNVRSQANSVSIPAMQDSFSWTFGHEVAETMSDPSPLFGAIHNGVNFAPGNLFLDDLGHQIGDNEGNSYSYREPNGALVQPLWSSLDQAWAVTDTNRQHVTLDPIWVDSSGNTFSTGANRFKIGVTFTGQFDLDITGDQFGVSGQPGSFDDYVVLDKTAAGGLLVTLNGEPFQFEPNTVRNVTINTAGGNDTVDLLSTVTNSPKVPDINYTINLSGGSATVNVMPLSSNLDGVIAPLTVHGNGNFSPGTLNLFDTLHAGGVDYQLADGVPSHSGVFSRFTNDVKHTALGGWIKFDYMATVNVKSAGLYRNHFEILDTPSVTNLEGSAAGSLVSVKGTTLPVTFKGSSSLDRVEVHDGVYRPNPTVDNYRINKIKGGVTVSETIPGQALDLTVDDGGDPVPQNVTLTDQGVWFGGGLLIGGTNLRNFTVVLGTASGSQVSVVATPNTGPVGSTTTHLDSYAKQVTVHVDGGIDDVQGVRGKLAIQQQQFGTNRLVDLTIDDSHDTVGRTVTLTRGGVSGLAPAMILFDETRLKSFSVSSGKGTNHFAILGTPDNGLGMPTILNTGSGTDWVAIDGTEGPHQVKGRSGVDFVTVGGIGQLKYLGAAVDLTNPTGQILLTIDDHLDTIGRFAALATDNLAFSYNTYAAPISWASANVSYLHFLGGSGGNDFAVTGFVNRSFDTAFESGSGNDKVQVFGGSGGSLYLDGNGDQDAVTIGNGSLTSVNGTVYLSNGAGHTSVVADDSTNSTNRNYRFFPSPLNLPYPGSLTLTGTNTAILFKPGQFNDFTLNAGTGSDNLAVLGLDNKVKLRFDGGKGSDSILGPAGANTWDITGKNAGTLDGQMSFTNVESLAGQNGADIFLFEPNGEVTGAIDGGGGDNWLDYTAVPTHVNVNLPTGKASLVGTGVQHIRNVRGGDHGNVLIGDGQGNIFVGGAGADFMLGGSGRNVMIGGGGGDILTAGAAGDLLISGKTIYDHDNTALAAIQAEWLSTDTYGQRIKKLKVDGVGPGNIYRLQFGVTVFADPVITHLFGGNGTDWYFASPIDVVTKQPGEIVN